MQSCRQTVLWEVPADVSLENVSWEKRQDLGLFNAAELRGLVGKAGRKVSFLVAHKCGSVAAGGMQSFRRENLVGGFRHQNTSGFTCHSRA